MSAEGRSNACNTTMFDSPMKYLKKDVIFTTSRRNSNSSFALLSDGDGRSLDYQDAVVNDDREAVDGLLKLNKRHVFSCLPPFHSTKQTSDWACDDQEGEKGYCDDDSFRMLGISPIDNCEDLSSMQEVSVEFGGEPCIKATCGPSGSVSSEADGETVTNYDRLHESRLHERRRIVTLKIPLIRKDLEADHQEGRLRKPDSWLLNEYFDPVQRDHDMYTPKYVTYKDSTRQGICPYCLGAFCLKNSSYRQHLCGKHGINPLTKNEFPRFLTSREDGQGLAIGLCLCGCWIPLQPRKCNRIYLISLSSYYRHCQAKARKHVIQ